MNCISIKVESWQEYIMQFIIYAVYYLRILTRIYYVVYYCKILNILRYLIKFLLLSWIHDILIMQRFTLIMFFSVFLFFCHSLCFFCFSVYFRKFSCQPDKYISQHRDTYEIYYLFVSEITLFNFIQLLLFNRKWACIYAIIFNHLNFEINNLYIL